MEDEEENNSVVIDFETGDASDGSAGELVLGPEDEFEGEFGYSYFKLFTGNSTGRKLKRDVFKFGLTQLVCGLALVCTIKEGEKNFYFSNYLRSENGSYYDKLMWFVSLLSILMGVFSLVMIRYWVSLTSNRNLLNSVLKLYMVIFVVILAFSMWCLVAFFLAFDKINWQDTSEAPNVRPFYACTIVFLLPYITQIFLYTMNISYLCEEMEMGGTIEEPNKPRNYMDLSNVTLCQSCAFIGILPVVVCMQGFGWLGTGFTLFLRCMGCDSRKKKKKSIFRRIVKTVSRWCGAVAGIFWHHPTEVMPATEEELSAAAISRNKLEQRLADIRDKREREEEKERERLEQEQQKHEERKAAEKKKKEEEEERQRQREEEEEAIRRKREQEADEKNEREKMERSPTLTVLQYKGLWTSLGSTGSFDCNLKSKPSMHALSEHMRKQGFHVVFASSNEDGSKDLELGICNVREDGTGPWYLARFLSVGNKFSAVMKCQDPSAVPNFVKKFALAKILKIDTNSGGK